MINCEVCVHIKYVSKSVNSAGLLQKGMFSNTPYAERKETGSDQLENEASWAW